VKVVAVVQARTGSSRLPGKVLLPLGGWPLLARMLERVRASRELDEVVVATTTLASDEPIRALATSVGVPCVSGHATDLLDRHRAAARFASADAVVKIPSDCPLIDPRVIDDVVGFYRANAERFDYVGNLHPQSWPDGNDVEVMSRDALETAWREAERPFQREHTTPFLWDQPARFRIGNVLAPWCRAAGVPEGMTVPGDLSASHRLTLDYREDYDLIAAVFTALHRPGEAPFTVEAIVYYLDAHPEVRALNARYGGDSWMVRHAHELATMGPAKTSETTEVTP
jgi:spore coat polysaccharide biosynthesis protein SpsF